MAQTHHWKFNTETQLEDTIGTNHFTQGYSTVTQISSFSVINQCLEFVEGYPSGTIRTSGNPFPASGAFSISFWWTARPQSNLVPPGGLGVGGNIFSVGNFRVSLWNLSIENPEFGQWPYRLMIEDYSVANGEFKLSEIIRVGSIFWNEGTNAFTHFTISWDGTDWFVYINGYYTNIISGTSFTPVSIYNSSNDLEFYADQNYSLFLDDVRIYDTADANDAAFVWNSRFGTEVVLGANPGEAYGLLPTILVSEPEGSAGGGVGASGGLTTIVITPPSGTAEFILDASASGAFVTITITTFSGIAFPEFIATGSLPVITVSAPEGSPVITTSIQLDYVACDAEVTWTQNLPITGFSSAIQGQDAISSRITPTIGGSGANIVYFEQRTLAASGTYTYDLMSLTDFLGGALSLSRAYAISITISSGSVSLEPGASNPFQWFFNSSTANISISSPGVFMFAQPESATITSGSKTLKVTNTSGAAAATYKIAILGGR